MKNLYGEEIAPDYEIDNKRKWTALKIAAATGFDYFSIIELLQRWDVHGNWSDWELENRPVNIAELVELVAEELKI